MRKFAIISLLAIGFAVVYLVAYARVAPADVANERKWVRVLYLRLSPNESIELGSQRETDNAWGVHFYSYNYLFWNHGGRVNKYYISENEGGPLAGVTLHMQRKSQPGIWLVGSEGNVICALDRKTGNFINSYGALVKPGLSEKQQEDLQRPRNDNTGPVEVTPYPKWATKAMVTVVARIPED